SSQARRSDRTNCIDAIWTLPLHSPRRQVPPQQNLRLTGTIPIACRLRDFSDPGKCPIWVRKVGYSRPPLQHDVCELRGRGTRVDASAPLLANKLRRGTIEIAGRVARGCPGSDASRNAAVLAVHRRRVTIDLAGEGRRLQ